MAKKYYTQDIPSVIEDFKTDANRGISGDEAAKRLAEHGANALGPLH